MRRYLDGSTTINGFGLGRSKRCRKSLLDFKSGQTTKEFSLEKLKSCLKGLDAMILNMLDHRQLRPSLYVHYDCNSYYRNNVEILCPRIVYIDGGGNPEDFSLMESLMDKKTGGGILIRWDITQRQLDFKEHAYDRYLYERYPIQPVTWILPQTKVNKLTTSYIAYGNEANVEHVYGHLVLAVQVGKPGERVVAV